MTGQPDPASALLHTKFGDVRIVANDCVSIRLGAGSPYDTDAEAGIKVYGVDYHFSLSLIWQPEFDLSWRVTDYRDLYLSRIHYRDGGLSANEPSYKAKQKVIEVMTGSVNEFMKTDEAKRILAQGEYKDAKRSHDRLHEEEEELERALTRKQGELVKADERVENALQTLMQAP